MDRVARLVHLWQKEGEDSSLAASFNHCCQRSGLGSAYKEVGREDQTLQRFRQCAPVSQLYPGIFLPVSPCVQPFCIRNAFIQNLQNINTSIPHNSIPRVVFPNLRGSTLSVRRLSRRNSRICFSIFDIICFQFHKHQNDAFGEKEIAGVKSNFVGTDLCAAFIRIGAEICTNEFVPTT